MAKQFILILSGFLLAFQCLTAQNSQDTNQFKHQAYFSYTVNYHGSGNFHYTWRLSDRWHLKGGLQLYFGSRYYDPSVSITYPQRSDQYELKISAGLERIKPLKGKLELMTGFQLFFGESITRTKVDNPTLPVKLMINTYYSPMYGATFTAGLFYSVSEQFAVGSYFCPEAYLSITKFPVNTTRDIVVNLMNFSIVSLRYRW
jgi:hypothetical protein